MCRAGTKVLSCSSLSWLYFSERERENERVGSKASISRLSLFFTRSLLARSLAA